MPKCKHLCACLLFLLVLLGPQCQEAAAPELPMPAEDNAIHLITKDCWRGVIEWHTDPGGAGTNWTLRAWIDTGGISSKHIYVESAEYEDVLQKAQAEIKKLK